MAAPSSAKESAPKRERMAPTIHAAKTTETVRPSRAISEGFRKMPVPIMVPTTIAPEAHAPNPRNSSRRFSAIFVLAEKGRPPRREPLRFHDAADRCAYGEGHQ